MFRILRVSILAASILVLGFCTVAEAQPDMENQPGMSKHWIYRRNAGDPNSHGDIAVVLKLTRPAGSMTEVEGTMYVWKNYNNVTNTYTDRHAYTLQAAPVQNAGQPNRKLEKCRLTGISAGSDPNITVFVSLYKGKEKDNGTVGRGQKRIVLRYKEMMGAGCEGGLQATGGCDEEPNEDVLVEEPNVDPTSVPYTP